jgi:hypothetical protein
MVGDTAERVSSLRLVDALPKDLECEMLRLVLRDSLGLPGFERGIKGAHDCDGVCEVLAGVFVSDPVKDEVVGVAT